MAEVSFSVTQDQLKCPVCLDLLKVPVTIFCGHSYCMSCITECWDQDDERGVYSCPLCKRTFTPRPALYKHVLLAELVEKMRNTVFQTAHYYVGPGDVECDVCTRRKHKAVKSCVECLNSYCHIHLHQHENLFKHKVINDPKRLQEMFCPQHFKPLEMYCRSDFQCICYFCAWYEHKDHAIVTADAERKEKQMLLKETQRKVQHKIQKRQKEFQELKEAVDFYKSFVQTAVTTAVLCYRSRSEVTELIRDQEKAAVGQAEALLKKLTREIADLGRRDTELKQLLNMDDHIHFLQSCSVLPGHTDTSSTISSVLDFEKSVSEIKEKLKGAHREEIENISSISRARNIQSVYVPEPKTREQFLQYFCHFTLDLNTINENLCLSEGDNTITYIETVQQYPDHPNRFDYAQVLCRESVCGRCYWEVEWSGDGWVDISVSYKSISRKGRGGECRFGFNDQSWKFLCSPSSYSFWHHYKETELAALSSYSRIGVYVDHSAGILAFYSVSDTMTLIQF